MITPELRAEVEEWILLDPDPKTAAVLQGWLNTGNETELKSAFSGFLQFGTAGLRGPIGAGPSRMNRAVVSRAASGIAAYMKERGLTSLKAPRYSVVRECKYLCFLDLFPHPYWPML
jgi:phosphomannomutase